MEQMGDKLPKKDWNDIPDLQGINDAEGKPEDMEDSGILNSMGGIPIGLTRSYGQKMDYYPYSPENDMIGEVIHFLIFDTGTTYKLYKRYQSYGSRALVEVKDDRLPCDTLEVVMDVILDHGGNEFHVFIRHR